MALHSAASPDAVASLRRAAVPARVAHRWVLLLAAALLALASGVLGPWVSPAGAATACVPTVVIAAAATDPFAPPFPNDFQQSGKAGGRIAGWSFCALGLYREGPLGGVFQFHPGSNPYAHLDQPDVTDPGVAGSMPAEFLGEVAIITPAGGVTGWGGPLRDGVLPTEFWLDPGSPVYYSPLDEMAYDAERDLYYAAPYPASGRQSASALLRFGDRLVLVESGWHISVDVINSFDYPEGRTLFDGDTEGTAIAEADTLALIAWAEGRQQAIADWSGSCTSLPWQVAAGAAAAAAAAVAIAGAAPGRKTTDDGARPRNPDETVGYVLQVNDRSFRVAAGAPAVLEATAWRVNALGALLPAPEATVSVQVPPTTPWLRVSPAHAAGSLRSQIALAGQPTSEQATVTIVGTAPGSQVVESVAVTAEAMHLEFF